MIKAGGAMGYQDAVCFNARDTCSLNFFEDG